MSKVDFSLYEMVKAIRADLDQIRTDDSLQKDATMALGSLDLELNAQVSKAGKTGIRFWLLDAGVEYEKEKMTKITLHFDAIDAPPKGARTTKNAARRPGRGRLVMARP